MNYTLPLDRISLSAYQQLLEKQHLLPGRRILQEQLAVRFDLLAGLGLSSVSQLNAALSTPNKLSALAAKTGIPEVYLTILRRELGSLTQKPIPLIDFPACDAALIRPLADAGLRTSKDYWEQGGTLSQELFSLCDLVRINGVGAVAACAFYEAGVGSVSAVASGNAADLLARISAVNAKKKYYKTKLGERDLKFCIDYAKLLMLYC